LVIAAFLVNTASANPYLTEERQGGLTVITETKSNIYHLEPIQWGCDNIVDVKDVLSVDENSMDAVFVSKVRENKCWLFPVAEVATIVFVTKIGAAALVKWQDLTVAIPATAIENVIPFDRPKRDKKGRLSYK
jgi:hypothetical protein